MAEGKIGVSGVSLNLEIVVPGIILAAELELVGINVFQMEDTTCRSIQGGLLFLALSYSLGLLALLVSRWIIDTSSEIWIRGFFLSNLAHSSCTELEAQYQELNKDQYEADTKKEEDRTWRVGAHTRKWNVIYRAALRHAGSDAEVKKRRSQGRIVRSMLVPTAVLMFVCSDKALPQFLAMRVLATRFLAICVGFLIAYAIILTLYAYAELMNFNEANDICMRGEDSKSRGEFKVSGTFSEVQL